MYPVGISKSFFNRKRHRKDGKGGKGWRVYGYTEDFKFRSKPFKSIFGIKPSLTMYKRRIGACFHCARRTLVMDEVKRLGFLRQKAEIICPKCQMESP